MGRRWVTCELLEETFKTFTLPRLTKVVRGEDMGGISVSKGERVDASADGLPDGMSAADAQKLTSLLNKAIKEHPELKKSADIKAVKTLVKTTKSKDTVNWRGGGSFQVATLSPACYDYNPEFELITLTPDATGDMLVRSVAAQRGFRLLTEASVFDAHRGKQMLKVVDGMVTTDDVDMLLEALGEGEQLVLAATAVADGVAGYLRKARRGSTLWHVPDDLFPLSDELIELNAAKTETTEGE